MTIKITKQLATVEDLAIGTGTVVQERNGVPLTLTKIDLITASKLASENAGEGAALVSMEGGPSVEVAVLDRVIRASIVASPTLTFNIPTDYATLQLAVDDLSSKYTAGNGITIDLLIEAGHNPTGGILVSNGNYSHFQISSVDAEVTLTNTFPTVDFIKGVYSAMPVLNCLINANANGVNGYFAENASTGKVNSGCGVRRANRHGLYASSSSLIVAGGSIFTEASQESAAYSGILSWASKIDAFGADVSDSLYYGAQSAASGTLYFRDGIANNCARHNIRATNGAITIARGASATGGGVSGVRSFDLGIVHATSIDVSGSFVGFWSANSSVIYAENATGNNTTSNFVFADSGGEVNVKGASATGVMGPAIAANNGSKVIATGATLATTGASLMDIDNGSTVESAGANLSHNGVEFGIDIRTGSTVNAHGATLNVPNARAVSCFHGSTFNIQDGDVTYLAGDAANISGGSLCRVKNSGILEGDVEGMNFNTLYDRGICWG